MLEVKKVPKAGAPPGYASPNSPAWPNSLYATPRIAPGYPRAATTESFVGEDIMEACRGAMQQLGTDGLTSLGITSSLEGEGRTTLALAIALVLAEYGLSTVLLELDLANGQLAHRLAVAKLPGLGDLAEGRANLADTIKPVSAGLSIIPAGQLQGSIPRALSELAKLELLASLEAEGFVVVADLPPLLGNSIGRQAASLMADLVLIVRAGVVPAASIKEAVAGLPVTPKVLLNGAKSHVPGWALRLSGI